MSERKSTAAEWRTKMKKRNFNGFLFFLFPSALSLFDSSAESFLSSSGWYDRCVDAARDVVAARERKQSLRNNFEGAAKCESHD